MNTQVLHIDNEEICQLVRELAELTGKRIDQIVLDALRIELACQQQRKTHIDELMAIGIQCAAHLDNPGLAVEHGDMLYDESGMPN